MMTDDIRPARPAPLGQLLPERDSSSPSVSFYTELHDARLEASLRAVLKEWLWQVNKGLSTEIQATLRLTCLEAGYVPVGGLVVTSYLRLSLRVDDPEQQKKIVHLGYQNRMIYPEELQWE